MRADDETAHPPSQRPQPDQQQPTSSSSPSSTTSPALAAHGEHLSPAVNGPPFPLHGQGAALASLHDPYALPPNGLPPSSYYEQQNQPGYEGGFESGYESDAQDMSDDGGVPLDNLPATAGVYSNDMDMDFTAFYEPELDMPDEIEPHAGPTHGLEPEPDLTPLMPEPYVPAQEPESVAGPEGDAPAAPPPLVAVPGQVGNGLNPPLPAVSVAEFEATHMQALLEALNLPGNPWMPHPPGASNSNVNSLGPDNLSLLPFLLHWCRQNELRRNPDAPCSRRFPRIHYVHRECVKSVSRVECCDLDGDECDLQGLDWKAMNVTRKDARQQRQRVYRNYVNKPGSDQWDPSLPDVKLLRSDNFFRFRRMDIRSDILLAHFQLRNILACSSRSQAFYAGAGAVREFNPISATSGVAMTLKSTSAPQVSTLAADYGVLVAGGFNGEYGLRRLDAYDENGRPHCVEGTITKNASGITNHIQLHLPRRSSTPRAAFASNDMGFRVLDLETETFVSRTMFDYPLNCSSLSPDKRLRVMVGDSCDVLITTSGDDGPLQVLQKLTGHRDFGFACDWADDGWTVATGFQDMSVKIWDARKWTKNGVPHPVRTIRTQMAGVRSLHFSPVGSGKRVLVAAEEADFVNIIDAQTFLSKQTIDIFGEIGGTSFSNDGQDLNILCCDRVRGGLLQLERCGLGEELTHDADDDSSFRGYGIRDGDAAYDWTEPAATPAGITRQSLARRRRRSAAVSGLTPF